jgi:hypothetical protein
MRAEVFAFRISLSANAHRRYDAAPAQHQQRGERLLKTQGAEWYVPTCTRDSYRDIRSFGDRDPAA